MGCEKVLGTPVACFCLPIAMMEACMGGCSCTGSPPNTVSRLLFQPPPLVLGPNAAPAMSTTGSSVGNPSPQKECCLVVVPGKSYHTWCIRVQVIGATILTAARTSAVDQQQLQCAFERFDTRKKKEGMSELRAALVEMGVRLSRKELGAALKTAGLSWGQPTPQQVLGDPLIAHMRKSYRMEDWLHFVETFSSYIFKGDVLPEALRALCWSLCSTVMHYFRPRPPDETREQFLVAAKAAACKLRAYMTRLEELEVLGYMFTVNLHICVCRLYDQECQLGSTAGFSEQPVERMMQQMKTQGGRMVSQAPEKHYTQWLCLMWASESLTEADPATGAKHTTNQQLERMLAQRAVNTEAAWFDKPGGNGYLLGRGHMVYPSPERVAQVRAAMASLVHWYALAFEDVASWTLGPNVYSGQVFSGGLVVVNMAAAQTARAGSQWEMWQDLGLPLSELEGKFCTAALEGDRKGLMYFMPYTHFTNR
ncbi:hypothetical protein VOLCADRAFT_93153 [Volvox carteri f. nagariensis]|uniref:Uncharacterized protein n=1 Tax=Volvox carteri f. nagariensis TaxID=3068 RepID=D8U1F8_VOLCA|nr:uncharacterized protein VOLCADRAFT_93153 [Volvox carteri f. nagariensis]EFJ46330.1 hypothetical protein VOLCADRAFT_93153 [Volvox carteri f. nagariensis]|eukprot:XP_002952483.1 hypothetical protein VOLCADRAFT_93153 [Volvox carteri f. nagariensis]